MKSFSVFTLVFACCFSVMAETFPIIDVRYGYLIGGVENGKWIESESATKAVKPGTKLQVYGVAGAVGSAAIVKLDTQNEPCEDRPVVKLNPRKMKQGAIAFGAKWNPLPRKPQSLDVKDKKHVDVVREFLRERGFKDPIVHVTQLVRVDVDGDGQDEFLISATRYKNGNEIPDESSPNTYSCVLLERMVGGKPRAELVAGEFYPQAKADAAPNKFEIAALLDLKGDGKIEIVVRSAYYEGDEISVYEMKSSGFEKALSVGCGL